MPSKKNRESDEIDPLSELTQLAQTLNLTAIRDEIGELLARAQKQAPSYSHFALQLLRCEATTRESRRLTRNLKRSGLPENVESLDSFDFSLRPKLEAPVVKELLNCRWVQEGGRNIICVGRPGLGKTRVLDNLGRAACLRGHTVLKVITQEMLEDLHASLADGTFKRAFRRYVKPDVLLLEEFGYGLFDNEVTRYLFRLVSARHGSRSIVLAANTGFRNWKRFFPSEAQAVATVDRLIDRATILRFTGKSFRKPKEILGAETDD